MTRNNNTEQGKDAAGTRHFRAERGHSPAESSRELPAATQKMPITASSNDKETTLSKAGMRPGRGISERSEGIPPAESGCELPAATQKMPITASSNDKETTLSKAGMRPGRGISERSEGIPPAESGCELPAAQQRLPRTAGCDANSSK